MGVGGMGGALTINHGVHIQEGDAGVPQQRGEPIERWRSSGRRSHVRLTLAIHPSHEVAIRFRLPLDLT